MISPHDASHHLHLSCFNSFMTANAKNHFSVVTTASQDYEGCYWECAGDTGFPLGVFFLALKCLRRCSFRQVILPCCHTPSLTPKDACHKKVSCSTCMPSIWKAPTSERSLFFQIVHSASMTATLITACSQDNNISTRQEANPQVSTRLTKVTRLHKSKTKKERSAKKNWQMFVHLIKKKFISD